MISLILHTNAVKKLQPLITSRTAESQKSKKTQRCLLEEQIYIRYKKNEVLAKKEG